MGRGAAVETTLQAPYREEETGPHSGRSHCRWIDDARPLRPSQQRNVPFSAVNRRPVPLITHLNPSQLNSSHLMRSVPRSQQPMQTGTQHPHAADTSNSEFEGTPCLKPQRAMHDGSTSVGSST